MTYDEWKQATPGWCEPDDLPDQVESDLYTRWSGSEYMVTCDAEQSADPDTLWLTVKLELARRDWRGDLLVALARLQKLL